MKTNTLLLVSLLAACTTELADPNAPPTPSAPPVENPDWDESKALRAQPCGSATLATCADATHGACGVVAPGGVGADACLPLFDWGVRADDRVEFASSTRRFTLDDLGRAPLTPAELDEASTMAEGIASTSLGDVADDDGLEPLASVSHGGSCSTTWYNCAKFKITAYAGHFNFEGVHYHTHFQWDNTSQPWYYCNVRGKLVNTYQLPCGTP